MKILITTLGILLMVQTAKAQEKIPASRLDSAFAPLKWRNIGPFRGGRSVTACGALDDPMTYYMGTTGGGLWKTEDAGQHWNNISDGYFRTGSVGAVSVSESDPNVVYCGMGEHAVRGVMTSHGDGMYKSTDRGKSWKSIGLEKTQHIARIVIDPTNPDVLYVAAQGNLYSPNPERGVYKSTDGGKSWEKALFVDDKTGCVELAIDPSNPMVLYAAMWEHQRLPWKVISGGPGSGMYKSINGGETWFKIEKGLPKEMGKMAISVSRANPDRLYALIESDSEKDLGGLFVSTNAGNSWSRVSDDNRLTQRAWYYIEVFADPQDEHTVYVMSAPALRSIDGGKSWERLTGTHGDFHDLWINPKNARNMIISNDGGSAISFNRGQSWSTQSNMPTAQFYRINVDNHYPYRIYAGQQDNSTVRIESEAIGSGAITESNWTASAGGESAFLAFDPDNPKYVLGGSYLGTIDVLDVEANASTNIMAAPIQYLGRETSDMKYRFNWNAPIIWSRHEPGTFYHGSQHLLRTRDMGNNWEEASPDLTRNEKEKQGKGGGPYTNEAVGAENYGTLAYVAESPHRAGEIWTASDDGLVQKTTNGGRSWQNVTPKGLPECLVNAIEFSPHDPSTVYIATTRYKFNDHTPGLYKSTNGGNSWTAISNGIPYGAFTRVVREDPGKKDLLYAGTETGIYISRDGGKSWNPFQLNLPVTPITDLKIHQGDLIAATSGRSFWILDDLEVIRNREEKSGEFILYPSEDAVIKNGYSPLSGSTEEFNGTNPLVGVNPANGVVLYYNLGEMDTMDVVLEITDDNGNLVRSLSSRREEGAKRWDGGPPTDPLLSKNIGLNRFVWDMRTASMTGIPNVYIESSFRGHKLSPGIYHFNLKSGNKSSTMSCQILPNPLYNLSPEDYRDYDMFMTTVEAELNDMHQKINILDSYRTQLKEIAKDISGNENLKPLITDINALVDALSGWDEEMIQRKSKAYDDVENFPNRFTANYLFMINHAESDIPKVNQPTKDRREELLEEWKTLNQQAQNFLNQSIPEMNKKLWDAGIGALRK